MALQLAKRKKKRGKYAYQVLLESTAAQKIEELAALQFIAPSQYLRVLVMKQLQSMEEV